MLCFVVKICITYVCVFLCLQGLNWKEYFTLKLKFCYHLLTLMSFQTLKKFVQLLKTNEDAFNEIWEISVPPLKVCSSKTLESFKHFGFQWQKSLKFHQNIFIYDPKMNERLMDTDM